MTFTYRILDEVTGNLLFSCPNMDRELRMDDILSRDGTIYKVESVLMIMNTTGHSEGQESDYSRPVAEVKVTVVP